MSKASQKRPMTPDEIEAAKMLRGVSFPPATFDKRFAATVSYLIVPPPPPACDCGFYAPTPELLIEVPHVSKHAETCPCSRPPWVPMIGEKMVPQLWRLVTRYRRQIRHPERMKYIRMAELLQATDFRKLQKGMKILAERARDRARYAKAMQAKATTPTTP